MSRLGGLLIRSRLGGLRERLDPESVGGAYLLGLRELASCCHGISTRRAIANAIALAERGVQEKVNERTGAALEAAGVTRSGAVAEPPPRPCPLIACAPRDGPDP